MDWQRFSNPSTNLSTPLGADVWMTVYMGGEDEGDPVTFDVPKGTVPLRVVEQGVSRFYGPDAQLSPTSANKFTVRWTDKRRGALEDVVEVELRRKNQTNPRPSRADIHRRVRAKLPIRRVCVAPSCKAAVVVCIGCLKRVCRHFSMSMGYLDFESGERRIQVRFAELRERTTVIMPLGVCNFCKTGPGSIDIKVAVSKLLVLAEEK